MSSSEFRQLEARADSSKAERLFRAAVSAFCSLTRPSRREISQLEDLALPLFESVSVESRRFVAAALSECEYAPPALVRRLCEEPIDIAAPLLIRSAALSDVDLIALIGRHGLPHARAISRRKDLNPTIADLIHAIEKPTLVHFPKGPGADDLAPPKADKLRKGGRPTPGMAAENARERLRVMMRPDVLDGRSSDGNRSDSRAYVKLRETALTGNSAFFQTALADALDIDFATARSVTQTESYSSLLVALRALDLNEDRAFLIAVAVFPTLFPHPQAIRLFLDRYRGMHRDVAQDRVRNWKVEELSNAMRATWPKPANAEEKTSGKERLRAS